MRQMLGSLIVTFIGSIICVSASSSGRRRFLLLVLGVLVVPDMSELKEAGFSVRVRARSSIGQPGSPTPCPRAEKLVELTLRQ